MKLFLQNLKAILIGCFLLSNLAAYAQFPTLGAPIFGVPGGVSNGNLDNLNKNIWFKVNGNMAGPAPHNKMQGYVTPGSKVDVNFNVNNNPNRYTMVTYTVSPTGVRNIYDYQSNFYNGGSPVQGNSNQQLVLVPTCKFEVYFVKGALVTTFTPTQPEVMTATGPAGNPYGNKVIDFAHGGSGVCDNCPTIANPTTCVNFRLLEVIDIPTAQQKELIFSVINNIGTINNSCGNYDYIGDVLFTNINPTHTGNNQPYAFRYNYQLGPSIPNYPVPTPPAHPGAAFVFDQRNNHNVLAYDVYQSEIFRFKISYAEYQRLLTSSTKAQICAELSSKHPEPHQTIPPVYCGEIDFGPCIPCPMPTADIMGPDTLCQFGDTAYTFTTTAIPGATYVWTVPASSFIDSGQGTNTITVFAGEFSGNVTVTVTNNCGTASDTKPVVLIECGPIIPTPVELLNFSGKADPEGIALNWSTATEQDNDRFEIERSPNGNTFEKIGFVKGHGNSSTRLDYDFTDKQPNQGLNYYRLKQVDFDGKHAYSEIVKVNANDQHKDLTVQLVPNPCRGENCTVQLKGFSGSHELNIELRDITGKLVFSQQLKADQTSLVLPKISSGSGIYILSAKDGTHSAYQKVIIQ